MQLVLITLSSSSPHVVLLTPDQNTHRINQSPLGDGPIVRVFLELNLREKQREWLTEEKINILKQNKKEIQTQTVY